MRIYARTEVPAVVERLLADPFVADAVVADRTLPAREADLRPFPAGSTSGSERASASAASRRSTATRRRRSSSSTPASTPAS